MGREQRRTTTQSAARVTTRLAGVASDGSKLSDCRLHRLAHDLRTLAVRSVAIEIEGNLDSENQGVAFENRVLLPE